MFRNPASSLGVAGRDTPLTWRSMCLCLFPPLMHKPSVTFRIGQQNVAVRISYQIASNSPMLNRDIVLEGVGIGLLRTTLVDQHI